MLKSHFSVKRWAMPVVGCVLGLSAVVVATLPAAPVSAATVYEVSVTSATTCNGANAAAAINDFVSDLTSITTGTDPVKNVNFTVGDTLKIVNNCPGTETIEVVNSSFYEAPGTLVGANTMGGMNGSNTWFDLQGVGLFDIANGQSLSITFTSARYEWGFLSRLVYDPQLGVPVLSAPVSPSSFADYTDGGTRTVNSAGDYRLSVSPPPPTNCAVQGSPIAQGASSVILTGQNLSSSIYGYPKIVWDQWDTFSSVNSQLSVDQAGTQVTLATNASGFFAANTGTFTKTYETSATTSCTLTWTVVVPPSVLPATQTVSGTAGTAITPSTAFTAANFTGAVSYAVTTGTLPAGLSLSASTGEVSGTPTSGSAASITITATGATSGTATATITFEIAAIVPATQTVAGTIGVAITPSTVFTASNFTGAVSYAVTTGVLPAGLSLSSSTGVVSGTPSADSTVSVTIAATGATAGTASALITFSITAAPVLTPATQTVSGTAGTAITASTAFTASNFTGAVSFAVTTGTLPAGLSLTSSTGVVSGTPTAVSTATVTVTATGATAGTATAAITFAIVAAVVAPTTTAVATTTIAPIATIAPTTTTTPGTGPQLVTSANQAVLTAEPGKATALVNGVAVTPQIVSASNSAAAQTEPAERSEAQVRELQQAAAAIETRLDTIAGGDSGVSVVRTDTGAAMTGIFDGVRVPVEDVVVVNAADTATLFAARDVRGNIVEVKPGAVLEVAANGDVAVQAYGLRSGEEVELVVMSTPTLLGKFTVDANGSIKTTAKLPTAIGTGNHTLVVASKSVKASLGLKLVKSTASLPATGSSSNELTNWAFMVLLSGAFMTLLVRSRRRLNVK